MANNYSTGTPIRTLMRNKESNTGTPIRTLIQNQASNRSLELKERKDKEIAQRAVELSNASHAMEDERENERQAAIQATIPQTSILSKTRNISSGISTAPTVGSVPLQKAEVQTRLENKVKANDAARSVADRISASHENETKQRGVQVGDVTIPSPYAIGQMKNNVSRFNQNILEQGALTRLNADNKKIATALELVQTKNPNEQDKANMATMQKQLIAEAESRIDFGAFKTDPNVQKLIEARFGANSYVQNENGEMVEQQGRTYDAKSYHDIILELATNGDIDVGESVTGMLQAADALRIAQQGRLGSAVEYLGQNRLASIAAIIDTSAAVAKDMYYAATDNTCQMLIDEHKYAQAWKQAAKLRESNDQNLSNGSARTVPYKSAQLAMANATKGQGEVGQFVTQNLISVADNVLNYAFGSASLAVMGTLAAGSAMNETVANGGSAEYALLRGVFQGAVEGITEKVSLDKVIKPAIYSPTVKEALKTYVQGFGIEASEELAAYLLDAAFDFATNYSEKEFSFGEAVSSALGGAFSAAILGGAATSVGLVKIAQVNHAAENIGKAIRAGKTNSAITSNNTMMLDNQLAAFQSLAKLYGLETKLNAIKTTGEKNIVDTKVEHGEEVYTAAELSGVNPAFEGSLRKLLSAENTSKLSNKDLGIMSLTSSHMLLSVTTSYAKDMDTSAVGYSAAGVLAGLSQNGYVSADEIMGFASAVASQSIQDGKAYTTREITDMAKQYNPDGVTLPVQDGVVMTSEDAKAVLAQAVNAKATVVNGVTSIYTDRNIGSAVDLKTAQARADIWYKLLNGETIEDVSSLNLTSPNTEKVYRSYTGQELTGTEEERAEKAKNVMQAAKEYGVQVEMQKQQEAAQQQAAVRVQEISDEANKILNEYKGDYKEREAFAAEYQSENAEATPEEIDTAYEEHLLDHQTAKFADGVYTKREAIKKFTDKDKQGIVLTPEEAERAWNNLQDRGAYIDASLYTAKEHERRAFQEQVAREVENARKENLERYAAEVNRKFGEREGITVKVVYGELSNKDEAIISGDRKTVLLNGDKISAEQASGRVFWHEYFHKLSNDNKSLISDVFQKAVEKGVTSHGNIMGTISQTRKRYARYYTEQNVKNGMSKRQAKEAAEKTVNEKGFIEEEVAANLLGGIVNDPNDNTLRRLAQNDFGGITRLYSAAKAFFTGDTTVTKAIEKAIQGARETEIESLKDENGDSLISVSGYNSDVARYKDKLDGIITAKEIDGIADNVRDTVGAISDIDSPVVSTETPLNRVRLDYSTIVAKRLLNQALIDRVTEKQGSLSKRPAMAVKSILNLLETDKKAIELSCALCYNEAAREKSEKKIRQFLEDPASVIEKAFADEAEQENAIKRATRYIAEGRFQSDTSLKDLYFGDQIDRKLYKTFLDHVKIEVPITEENRIIAMEHRSMYDLLTKDNDRVVPLSDYIMDSIQLSGRKVAINTTSAEFIRAMAETGMAVNAAIVPGTDYGMDYETALSLRKQFPQTVGITAIVTNDEQLISAINDENIDVVLPYYTRPAEHRLPGGSAWHTYGGERNEVFEGGRRKSINKDKKLLAGWFSRKGISDTEGFRNRLAERMEYQHNQYDEHDPNDKTYGARLAMQEAANQYISACTGRRFRPKFERFSDQLGYWKLLVERKMFNQETGKFIEQMEVQPRFNTKELLGIVARATDAHATNGADFEAATKNLENVEDVMLNAEVAGVGAAAKATEEPAPTAIRFSVSMDLAEKLLGGDAETSDYIEAIRARNAEIQNLADEINTSIASKIETGLVAEASAQRLASSIIRKTYNSQLLAPEIVEKLTDLYTYIALGKGGKKKQANRNAIAADIAMTLVQNAKELSPESGNADLYRQHADVRKYLKAKKIYLDASDVAEVTGEFGSFKDFKNAFPGYHFVVTESKGTAFDTFAEELHQMNPELFSEVDHATGKPYGSINELVDILRTLRNEKPSTDDYINPYYDERAGIVEQERQIAEATADLANTILERTVKEIRENEPGLMDVVPEEQKPKVEEVRQNVDALTEKTNEALKFAEKAIKLNTENLDRTRRVERREFITKAQADAEKIARAETEAKKREQRIARLEKMITNREDKIAQQKRDISDRKIIEKELTRELHESWSDEEKADKQAAKATRRAEKAEEKLAFERERAEEARLRETEDAKRAEESIKKELAFKKKLQEEVPVNENLPENGNAAVNTLSQHSRLNKTEHKILATAYRVLTQAPNSLYKMFVDRNVAARDVSKMQQSKINLDQYMTYYMGSSSGVESIFTKGLVARDGHFLNNKSLDDMIHVHYGEEGSEVPGERKKHVDYTATLLLHDYMLHQLNITRMSRLDEANERLEELKARHPSLYLADKERNRALAMKTEEAVRLYGEDVSAAWDEYNRLIRQIEKVENKPIFDDGKGKPLSASTSRQIVADYEKNSPWVIDKANAMREWWNSFMKEYAVGMSLDEKMWDYLQAAYPHYVPTYRTEYGVGGAFYKRGKNMGANKSTEQLEGSIKQVMSLEDSYADLVKKLVSLRRGSEMLLNLIEEARDKPDRFEGRVVFENEKTSKEEENPVLDILNSEEDTEIKKADETVSKKMLEVDKKTGKYRISAWKNGQCLSALVDEELFRSLQFTLGKNPLGEFAQSAERLGHKVSAPMKAAITGYNPMFAVRNVLRDIPTAVINSQHGFGIMKYIPKAVIEMMKNTQNWQVYQNLGGSNAGYYNNENGFVSWMNSRTGWKGTAREIADKAKLLNDVTEAMTRFSEYLATIDQEGDTYIGRIHALKNAAEVTVDFSRKGEVGGLINAWTPYWNPAVQGIDKVFRAVGEQKTFKDKVKIIGRAVAVTMLPEIVLMTALKAATDDPEKDYYNEWMKLNDRTKNTYYCIPMWGDGWGEKGKFLKVPKNREWAALLGSSLMNLMERHNGRDDPWQNQLMSYLDNTIYPNFLPGSPVGVKGVQTATRPDGSIHFDFDMTPTSDIVLLSSLQDILRNEDFKGSPIVSSKFKDYSTGKYISPELQYDAETSAFTTWLANASPLKFSPAQADYIIESYFGDFGRAFVSMTSNGAFEDGFDLGTFAEATKQTFGSSFVGDNAYSSQVQADYYNMIESLQQMVTDKSEILERGLGKDKGKDALKQTVEYKTLHALQDGNSGLADQAAALSKEIAQTVDVHEKRAAKFELAKIQQEALDFYKNSMSGEIDEPLLQVKYSSLDDQEISDELIRLDDFTAHFNIGPVHASVSAYSAPDSDDGKKMEYQLSEQDKAVRKQLETAAYKEIVHDVMSSDEYKRASDKGKVRMLENATRDKKDGVTARIKGDLMEYISANITPTEKYDKESE